MATLLVFLKRPHPGRVKTRLAKTVGDAEAAQLYQGWIGTILQSLQPLRESVAIVGYFSGGDENDFVQWNPFVDQWWPQPDGDLGQRLTVGFERGHAASSPTLAIGTDCLDITPMFISQAIEQLQHHDAVFGPSSDGGYTIVGTARNIPTFFDNVPWSSSETLQSHLQQCERLNLSVGLLAELHDIDTWDDWQRHLQRRGEA